MPDYRSRHLAMPKSWKLAVADLRELRSSIYVQVQAELRYRRCSDALLQQALTSPGYYPINDEARPATAPAGPPATR